MGLQSIERPVTDPVLARVRAELQALYGDRIDRVVLFGSRARGDARPDSDYDIAVFLKDMSDRWAEFDRLADLRIVLLDETGSFIDARPFAATAFDDRTPLMDDIRRDGVIM